VHLTRLALTDFRSYVAVDLRLPPGVSAFTGRNGQGKTNLLEAAVYIATFGSHRVATDAPLIRSGAQRAILRAAVTSGPLNSQLRTGSPAPGTGSPAASTGGPAGAGAAATEPDSVPPGDGRGVSRETLIEIEVNAGRANRVRLNRVPLPRPRDAVGTLRCVLFAPEDLAMVKGEPDQRRRYLDDLLVATRPRFAGIRADYERVVRQRTALLKSARSHRAGASGGYRGPVPRGTGGASAGSAPGSTTDAPGALEVWDEHLIALGAELTAGRLDLVTALAPLMAKAYAAVSGEGDIVTMSYRQPGDAAAASRPAEHPATRQRLSQAMFPVTADRQALADALRQALARARRAELERGVCLVGPHRDDLELTIGELPARGYASHGESWSLALALRIAAYDLLGSGGDDPVLLLDDVFAELDDERRERLASLVSGAEQVLVTAAVPADVPARLAGRRYQVSAGEIRDA
jgi:DNA replication and repair protein RecF